MTTLHHKDIHLIHNNEMTFIHSNKKYIQRSMYLINPYVQETTPSVDYTMEAFVAPADFDPDAQELNIVTAFDTYDNVDKKYIFSVGTTAITVLPAVTGRSYAYAENGGAYTVISSGTVTWTVGSTKRHVIVIDSTESIMANVPTGGVWAYMSNSCYSASSMYNANLKYLHCQSLSSIIQLSNYSFSTCSELTGNLTIPPYVVAIGNEAFGYCPKIVGDLIIPDGIEYIGVASFRKIGCTGVLSLPSSIKTIQAFAFTSVKFTINNFILPPQLTLLGVYAFSDNTGLTGTIEFPNTLSDTNSAFMNCTNLTGVKFNLGNTIIGSYEGCTNLTGYIDIPIGATTINQRAFVNTKITGVNIPDTITYIGRNAFQGCNSISQITIPYQVSTIYIGTFDGCTNILEITLLGVANIYSFAFRNCYNLKKINNYTAVPQEIPDYTVFSGIDTSSCVIHVPIGSLAAYQATPYWNSFTNIIADL